jgi:hypothetical protein
MHDNDLHEHDNDLHEHDNDLHEHDMHDIVHDIMANDYLQCNGHRIMCYL